MPTKLFKCERCDYTHEKKKNIIRHEKHCDEFKTCDHCRYLSWWWGSFSCTSNKSYYKDTVVIDCVIDSHSCEFWKRAK